MNVTEDSIFRCLIVDDEHLARTLLSTYVEKLPNLTLISTCQNAMEALAVLQKQEVDIMFLDIQMPDLTGLDLLRTLGKKPATVLTTAYDKHAIEGYELEVMDYLLKPISFERFVQAVSKCSEQIQLKRKAEASKAMEFSVEKSSNSTKASHPSKQTDHMYVKVDYKWTKILYKDILYIEGLREYVKVHTPTQRYVVYQALKRLAEWLPEHQFVRVHKSYIVSLDYISAIYGNTIEIGEAEVPIGKSFKEEFFQRIQRI